MPGPRTRGTEPCVSQWTNAASMVWTKELWKPERLAAGEIEQGVQESSASTL